MMVEFKDHKIKGKKNTDESKWKFDALQDDLALLIYDHTDDAKITLNVNQKIVQYYFCLEGSVNFGFFIDFIEIIFIIIPVIYPALVAMDIDLLWFGILMALNLQTSFLTPPFGFALFYLKGVAPPEVKTTDIYKGIIPFMIIQLLVLLLVFLFPSLVQYFL